MGSLVIRRRDGAESFLPSRVPDLQLDLLAPQLDRLEFKIYADRGEMVVGADVLAKSHEHTRLTNS